MNAKIEQYQRMIDAETQALIKSAVEEIRARNPAMSFAEAYNQLAREKPELFPKVEAGDQSAVNPEHVKEMVSLSRDALQREIKAAVAEVQREKPGLSFQSAYALLQTRRPGLFLPDDAADKAEEEGVG